MSKLTLTTASCLMTVTAITAWLLSLLSTPRFVITTLMTLGFPRHLPSFRLGVSLRPVQLALISWQDDIRLTTYLGYGTASNTWGYAYNSPFDGNLDTYAEGSDSGNPIVTMTGTATPVLWVRLHPIT